MKKSLSIAQLKLSGLSFVVSPYKIALILILQLNVHILCAQVSGPGNVTSNLKAWYRADIAPTGYTNSGTTWYDYSGSQLNATGNNSVSINSNAINFNPAYYLNSTTQQTLSFSPTTLATGNTARTVLAVTYPDNGFSSNLATLFSYGYATSNTGQSYRLGGSTNYVVVDYSNGIYRWNANMGYVPYIVGVGNAAGTNPVYLIANGAITNSSLSAASVNTTISGTMAYIGIDKPNNIYYSGHVAEFIFYNQELGTSDMNKVLSYLAVKYGITLGQVGTSAPTATSYSASDGTVYWTADNTFKYNITGIGRDDASTLYQKQSRSINTANGGNYLTIAKGTSIAATNVGNVQTFVADKSFFTIGDNNGTTAISATSNNITVDGIAKSFYPIGRTWHVQKTNYTDVSTSPDGYITLKADFSSYSGNKPNYLIVGDDANLNAATPNLAAYTLDVNGLASVKSSSLSNGSYLTFAYSTNTLLPITYKVPLVATKQMGGVLLGWQTSQENNNAGFTVLRSDGSQNWTMIGSVPSYFSNGLGNGHTYSFTDSKPLNGINFYKLMQSDLDGKKIYSDVVSISIADNNNIKLYPTIVSSTATLTGLTPGTTISLVSSTGAVLKSVVASSETFALDCTTLPSGMYILQIINSTKKQVLPFIKQ